MYTRIIIHTHTYILTIHLISSNKIKKFNVLTSVSIWINVLITSTKCVKYKKVYYIPSIEYIKNAWPQSNLEKKANKKNKYFVFVFTQVD